MTRASRRGFALPILLLALFGAAVVWAVYATRLVGSFDQRAKIQTETALRIARDALIQYAAQSSTSPGALPCPDTSNDGTAGADNGGSCSAGVIGRVPWRTLGINPPRDGAGECIWYVPSGGARNQLQVETRGKSQPALNPGWTGTITLHDHSSGSDSQVMAVLIAPGAALQGQSRTSNSRCNGGPASAFLEALDGIDDASGTAAVRAAAVTGFNDRVLPITAQDLYAAVAPRILAELAGADANHGFRSLLLDAPAASFVGTDGLLNLDFLAPATTAAYSTTSVTPSPLYGCPDYPTGTFAIQWLCFNQWTQWIEPVPDSDTQIRLILPPTSYHAFNWRWQIVASPLTGRKLQRLAGG